MNIHNTTFCVFCQTLRLFLLTFWACYIIIGKQVFSMKMEGKMLFFSGKYFSQTQRLVWGKDPPKKRGDISPILFQISIELEHDLELVYLMEDQFGISEITQVFLGDKEFSFVKHPSPSEGLRVPVKFRLEKRESPINGITFWRGTWSSISDPFNFLGSCQCIMMEMEPEFTKPLPNVRHI